MDLIATDDAHFSNLLAKLPPDLLNPPEDAEEGNSKFYKNHGGKAPEKERKEALLQRKEASKRARRAKYDVEDGDDEDASDDDGGAEDGEAAAAAGATPSLKTRSEPLDVLRSRLRERLEGLSGSRGGEPKQKKQTKKQAKEEEKKRKAAAEREKEARGAKRQRDAAAAAGGDGGAAAVEGPGAAAVQDVRFGALRDGSRQAPVAAKVGAPGSKAKKLKTLLARAEKDAAALADLRASGDDAKAEKLQWADALRVASGAKAPVDPAKLKKALKAREKKKEKSAREWKEREKKGAEAAGKKTVPNGRRTPRDAPPPS